MIQYVYIPKRPGKRSRSVAEYYGRFKFDGDPTITTMPLHTTDKRVAEQRLEAIVRERRDELAGIIAPKLMREAAKRDLCEHLTEFVADLKQRGRVKRYYYPILRRVTMLADACGWRFPADVTADSFVAWRSRSSLGAKTLNEYLNAASGLFNWMQANGRVPANPLRGVGMVKAKPTFQRRAFTEGEVRRLLQAAPVRSAAYLLAVLTGLRRGELAALRWADLHLDAVHPFLVARASTTKNGKAATIWLRDDAVAALRGIQRSTDRPGGPVFRRGIPKMETFKVDLAKAGIAYEDTLGRRADFHSLRHTLATELARSQVPPRIAMEVMRHSEMRLTMNTYTDASLLPTRDVMDRLPRYDAEPIESDALRATGTCDDRPTEKRSQMCSQTGVISGHVRSSAVADGRMTETHESPENRANCRDLTLVVASGEGSEKVPEEGLEPTLL